MSQTEAPDLTAHCFKCKTKREMRMPQAEYNKAGSPATRGKCAECGTAMYRTGYTPAHDGLPKPERIEKPARKTTKPKTKAKTRKKRAKSSSKNGKSRGRAKKPQIGQLVIVESPAKARSIGGFLGSGYTVLSSKGHVRDLLKSRLSVDVEANFEPEYRVPNDKRAVVKELRAAAEGADEIYLATDPDREGEAIAWHLVTAAEMPPANVRRVVFHEITDRAVAEAFADPRPINIDLVNAQQARRILDRLVGYQVSQLLWSKVRNGLSAGRVQSIALRLVVEREKEIEAFKPVEYWTIEASLAKRAKQQPAPFKARLVRIAGDSVIFDPNKPAAPVLNSEAVVKPHVDILQNCDFVVDSVKRGTKTTGPAAPFTTSTLQQAASNTRGLSASRTMRIAQQLYEGIDLGSGNPVGLITYMRTDSVNVSAESQAEARKYIRGKHGDAFLPKTPPKYKTRSKTAQEAHEAIRPTSVMRSPDSLRDRLDRSQLQLYSLIWNRFVASQMSRAVYDTLRIEVKAGVSKADMPYLFRASGSKLKFPGYLILNPTRGANGESQLDFPDLQPGEILERKQILPEQHFTQPPKRYSEATLVRQLEELGIGRPSTYAPTVTVIQTREYVTREGRSLKPTKTGKVVCELLTEFFKDEMDYAFTAKMEDQLDEISQGNRDWRPMLDEFYHPFEQRLFNARENMPKRDVVEKVGRVCPTCGQGDLVIKHSRYGKFIGCSAYPDCRHTERYLERKGYLCPQCGERERGEVVERRSRKGRAFFGCSRYPDCDFTVWRLPRGLVKLDAAKDSEPAAV